MTAPLSIPCGRCEAHIGEPCRTISGKRSTGTHSARTGPLNEAWREGYADGLERAARDPGYARTFVDSRSDAH